MPTLAEYGRALASTTIALRQLLDSALPVAEVTTRTPDAARTGVVGASVNLFLYRDHLLSYRTGDEPGLSRALGAELHYLVSTHPGDGADTDAASQISFGTARAAIELNPVLSVVLGANDSIQVQLTSTDLTIPDLTSLWLASTAPLRLSFGVTARFALDAHERNPIGTIHDVISRASAGMLVTFSGTDAAAKREAAASVAHNLRQALVEVELDNIVSKYIGETEKHLDDVFARAGSKESVLFFDEADALFGTRTEVHDAHNRFANIEPGPVLELLVRAPGVVIIAVGDTVGEELARRTAVEVRFPPD